MPNTENDNGLVGEHAKAEWLPEYIADQQRKMNKELGIDMKISTPWTSLGQAPTAEQVDNNQITT